MNKSVWLILSTPRTAQSLVELALVLPVLLLILLGAIDLGRVFNTYVAITNASREGARYGANHSTSSTLTANIRSRAITEAAGSGVTLSPSDITIACAAYSSFPPGTFSTCSNPARGDMLRVTINVGFQFETLYIFGFQTITVTNNTVMPIIQ